MVWEECEDQGHLPPFEQEPGVIILGRPETKHKRQHRSIRIPCGDYERVVRRISVK